MTTVDSPLGTVTRDGDRDVVEFRRTYPDPPETVWATLTESDRLARWYGSFTGDARPGGTIQLTIPYCTTSSNPSGRLARTTSRTASMAGRRSSGSPAR